MCEEDAMLDQAVQAFSQRAGTVVLKKRAVSKNAIDVETTTEAVRITLDAGSVTLVGWCKASTQQRGHYVISGVYFPSSGWRFGGKTFTDKEYALVKGSLPK
jgi:hypothetical protein